MISHLFPRFTIPSLFLPLLLLTASSVTAQDSLPNAGKLKIRAVREELMLENVNIKLVGSGDDVMLEGFVSHKKLSRMASETASEYFSKVFNILSVDKPDFEYELGAMLYEIREDNPMGSRYADVLSQGSLLEKPWHFLFFDTGEKEDFQTEIRDIFAARPLRSSPPDSSGGSYTKEFAMENGRQLICSLSADSMDNGYLRCSVVVVGIRGTGSETLFGKDLYCRQGEWIALTGFSRSPFLKADATPPGTRHDLILLFKPSIRVSN